MASPHELESGPGAHRFPEEPGGESSLTRAEDWIDSIEEEDETRFILTVFRVSRIAERPCHVPQFQSG